MKLTELFESVVNEPFNHWELIRYTHSGLCHEGFITAVYDDHIVARVMANDIDAKFQNVILYKQVFRGLNVEFLNREIRNEPEFVSLADTVGA